MEAFMSELTIADEVELKHIDSSYFLSKWAERKNLSKHPRIITRLMELNSKVSFI